MDCPILVKTTLVGADPRETVVSEKLEAMVKLGIASRGMKDLHDLHSLLKTFEFDGKALIDAVRATCEPRGTAWPDEGTPLAFTSEFYEDENKIKQWRAFCKGTNQACKKSN